MRCIGAGYTKYQLMTLFLNLKKKERTKNRMKNKVELQSNWVEQFWLDVGVTHVIVDAVCQHAVLLLCIFQ